jgi:hypothetical protein
MSKGQHPRGKAIQRSGDNQTLVGPSVAELPLAHLHSTSQRWTLQGARLKRRAGKYDRPSSSQTLSLKAIFAFVVHKRFSRMRRDGGGRAGDSRKRAQPSSALAKARVVSEGMVRPTAVLGGYPRLVSVRTHIQAAFIITNVSCLAPG